MSETNPEDADANAAKRSQDVDIGALLGVALGPPPTDDFADKVGSKVTLMTTVTEFALMMFAAPFDWLRAEPPTDDRDAP
ncbi:MAG: hypothetical protein AAGA54_19860 [Myxococcota bacterium]